MLIAAIQVTKTPSASSRNPLIASTNVWSLSDNATLFFKARRSSVISSRGGTVATAHPPRWTSVLGLAAPVLPAAYPHRCRQIWRTWIWQAFRVTSLVVVYPWLWPCSGQDTIHEACDVGGRGTLFAGRFLWSTYARSDGQAKQLHSMSIVVMVHFWQR